MHLLHLSDTHNFHRQLVNLPAADAIIHSGDVAMAGTGKEVSDFINWFGELDYKYKIFIAGNHDDCLDGKDGNLIQSYLPENCFYLCHSGVEIEGVKFWGVPLFMSDELDGDYADKIANIPPDIDVLITHRPPYAILDKAGKINFGCPDLLQYVEKNRPKLLLFGHIHDAYGTETLLNTRFSNAAIVDKDYYLANTPHIFDL